LVIDPVSHTLYVGDWGTNTDVTGVRQFTYNPTNGALTPLATNGGFLFTATQTESTPGNTATTRYTNANAFYLDTVNHLLYYVDDDSGYNTSPYHPTNAVYVVSTNGPTFGPTQLSSTGAGTGQFPTANQIPGNPSSFIGAHGNLIGLAVDVAHSIVYFESTDITGSANNALWWVNASGAGQTATKIDLSAASVTLNFAGQSNEGGDAAGLTFDSQTRQLYLSDANEDGVNHNIGAIYELQLDSTGHNVTLVQKFDTATLVGQSAATVNPFDAPSATTFDILPTLTVSGTTTHAVEQSTAVTLLTGAPTITDPDGADLASATVQITGGTFSSNETSANDDHLGFAAANVTGSQINGTSITFSYNNATETLTLTGYDTFAHYQTALSEVQYNTTGDNPTNYGNNTTRTLTWQANDGAIGNPSGANNVKTTTLSIDAVNDAPVNSVPGAQSVNEDTTKVFSSGNGNQISISDVDALSSQVTLTATHGTLTLNGTSGLSFTAGDGTADSTMTFSGTITNIDAALNGMSFAPTANFNGSGGNAASLQIVTNDQGATGSGGALSDTDAVTITVVPVNDPPQGTDNTKTILEDNAYTFAAADFGFSDPIDAASNSGANQFLAVKITTLPTAGTLTNNGVAVTTGATVLVSAINANKLVFTPAANANGSNYSHFTFQVQDDGGIANGGVDLDQSANTFTFNVTAVNDAPVGTDNAKTILEDGSYTFAVADFGFSDAADANAPSTSGANNFQDVIITTLPAAGSLTLSNVAVTAGQSITVANIPNLVFTPAANGNGNSYASFTFQVQDDGGLANSGQDTDQSPNTFTFNVTAVNDEPSGADKTVTTNEDIPYTFATADFGFTDPVDAASGGGANSLLAVKITTLPSAGTLTDNNVAVNAGDFIPVADITGGKLKFVPAANANGIPYTAFTFQVQDNGGVANGGVDLDQSPNTITINVNPVNDPPQGNDNTKTILEDNAYTFATADFGFSDPVEGNAFLAVKITTLPAAGTLANNNVAVTAGQFISVSDLNGGKLKFTPAADANGNGYASFTFQVQDDGGLANGGIDTDPTPNTFAFNVTAVNDEPAGADKTITTNEDTAYTFAAGDFGFTDPKDSPPNTLLAVKITTLPVADSLTDNNVVVTAGQFIPVADINGNKLQFAPATDANGNAYASFTFQVQDDGGIANSGIDLDQSANTITVNVNAVNDAPVLDNSGNMFLNSIPQNVPAASNPGTLVSDIILSAGGDRITDVDSGAVEGIAVTAVDNTNGTWEFSTNNGGVWTAFGSPTGTTARLLASDANTRIRFQPNAAFTGTVDPGITFRAWDQTSGTNGNTADASVNGGTTAFSTATETASITVASTVSVQDAKVAEPTSGTANMLFTVVLNAPAAAGGASVQYATADQAPGAGHAVGGATGSCGTPGVDYESKALTTLNFAAGEQFKTVTVTVCSDTDNAETDETFLLNLSSPVNTSIADGQATGTITNANTAGTFLISELRTSGPGGLGDDFVELNNNTNSPLTVAASDASAGYGVYKMGTDCNATPVLIATIPNGTVIPARGHYLLVGSQYSLKDYGGTNAAAGNQTLTSDIETDRNVAVFSTANLANISSTNRLDAVGFGTNTGTVCDLLREGTNLPAITGSSGEAKEYSFFRKECDFVNGVGCTTGDKPKDTNDNSVDFLLADTTGFDFDPGAGTQQHLGAPGPENSGSPINRDATMAVVLLDVSAGQANPPNRVRDVTSDVANASTFGTLAVRRRIVNNTGANVTRLRFRIVEFTTLPPPNGTTADLRARTSTNVVVSGINDAATCLASTGSSTTPCTVTVKGTTLEQPPTQAPAIGGGLNATLAEGTITVGTPLAPGASTNVQFLLGIQTTGSFRFLIIVEALP
jgi:hypothetical protein